MISLSKLHKEGMSSIPPQEVGNTTELIDQSVHNATTHAPVVPFIEIFEVPVGAVVLLSFCYGLVSLVAVVGNISVLWVVVSRRRMRTVTNYFIGNLALADIVIALFAVPFQFQAALLQKWLLPAFFCAFCPFVQALSVTVSVFTLSAIACDRYRAVFKPFNRRGTSKMCAKLIILGIWVLGGMAASPYAIAFRVRPTYDVRLGDMKPFCSNVRVSRKVWAMYHCVLVALQYFLPLCFISYAYGKMGYRLRSADGTKESRDETVLKSKRKVIKMLSIVVALFAICWLPFQTYNVLNEMIPKINEYKYINVIWFVAHWLAMSNSCYNPFIYAIYNDRFKKEFGDRLRCKKRRERPVYDSDTVLFSMPDSSLWTRRSVIVHNILFELEKDLEEKDQTSQSNELPVMESPIDDFKIDASIIT